jgi:predicted PurR-regulated permease PerM
VDREIEPARLSLAQYTYRVLIAVAIVALAFLLWQLSQVVMLAFGGLLLASVLRAMSDPLDRITPLSSRASLLVAIVILAGVIAGSAWLIGGQVAQQTEQLVNILPGAVLGLREWLENHPWGQWAVDLGRQGAEDMRGGWSGVARFASGTFGALANALLIMFLGLYLAADPGLYRRGLLALIPAQARERTGLALDQAAFALKRWLLGQLFAMLAVGAVTGIGLTLLGVPQALSLALIAGLLEFIPFVGPILAAIPALLVTFVQGGMTPLYVALLYLAVQQIEGYVLMPIVQKWAVSLPPALTIIGVVVFGLLFGVLGVLFATPLMVVVLVLVQRLYVDTAIEHRPPRRRGRSAVG